MIIFQCSKCCEGLEAPEALIGSQIDCPKCQQSNTVPPRTDLTFFLPKPVHFGIGLKILFWVFIPFIVLFLLSFWARENDQNYRAQMRRGEPTEVCIVDNSVPLKTPVLGVVSLLLLAIAISGWRREQLLRDIRDQQKAAQEPPKADQ